ncbi:MAG TPA: TolC family outer membrane protein, partial [Gammaproteobacteria bacterium]
RFEVGLIAITDVHEAQARYDNVLFEEIRAQNDVDNAREALRVITAAYHGELADLAAELPLKRPEPGNIDDWVAAAQRDNLSLVAARHGVEVAREEIGIQRAAQLPTVDAIAAYAHSDDNADRLGRGRLDSGRVGLELNLPLYTGGAIDSRARQAEARFLQASELLEQARRSVERQTRDAYRNVNAAISGVEALRQAVVSNQSALDATQAGFEVGTRTIVDVLDAQRDLFRAQRDYDLARYAYVLSTLTLQQAVGSLGGDDVEQVNRLLE